jgi:hypothetical protein
VRLWAAATGHVAWRAPALLQRTLELFTHQGWTALRDAPSAAAPSAWRRALEERGRHASEDVASATLCLRTDDGVVELWRVEDDVQVRTEAVGEINDVLAIPGGCLVLAGREARLIGASSTQVLRADATAIAWDHGEVLIAVDGSIARFTPAGGPLEPLPGAREVTAVARIDGALVLGFTNGNIEPPAAAGFSFADVPSTPVVRLLEGPPGTLLAGYANGLVGIWAIDNGARLFSTRLHGPIAYLVVAGDELLAASELGDHAAIDLASFREDRCTLLATVWRQVPVIWEGGLPVKRAPPRDHPCAR